MIHYATIKEPLFSHQITTIYHQIIHKLTISLPSMNHGALRVDPHNFLSAQQVVFGAGAGDGEPALDFIKRFQGAWQRKIVEWLENGYVDGWSEAD